MFDPYKTHIECVVDDGECQPHPCKLWVEKCEGGYRGVSAYPSRWFFTNRGVYLHEDCEHEVHRGPVRATRADAWLDIHEFAYEYCNPQYKHTIFVHGGKPCRFIGKVKARNLKRKSKRR